MYLTNNLKLLYHYSIFVIFFISLIFLYFIYNAEYRLGDIVLNPKINNIFNRTIYKIKWRNNIGSKYYSKTKELNNFKILYDIIKEIRDKEKIKIPDKKTLIIHLRVGDVIEIEYKGNIDDLLEGKGTYMGSDGWLYLKDYEYFLSNIEKIKEDINKVIFVGNSLHGIKGKNNNRSYEYISKIKNKIKENYPHYIFEDRLDKYTADEDFIFMANSHYFLRSGGGFSKIINEMVKLNGGNTLVPNYDDTYYRDNLNEKYRDI